MAGILARIPFLGSLSHPSRNYGFAAYVCRELGGPSPLALNAQKVNGAGITASLLEVIKVLQAEERRLEALPIVVLLEHYHACYSRRPETWLAARLIRLGILIESHLFSQAAAMFADIHLSIFAIVKGVYHNALLQAESLDKGNTASASASASGFDCSVHGYDMYNSPPYFNHKPPESEENMKCLSWIASFADSFQAFASKFMVNLPEIKLSPEEQEAAAAKKAEEDALAAAAAAEAEKKAAKGGKAAGKGKESVNDKPADTQSSSNR
jgi:hypothetical protein